MSLKTGACLGPYEVLSLIAEGEVYRGHDTKLNRDVAVKAGWTDPET